MEFYAGRPIEVLSRGERVIEAVFAGDDPGATVRLKGDITDAGVVMNSQSKYYCHKNRFTFSVKSPYYQVKEVKPDEH